MRTELTLLAFAVTVLLLVVGTVVVVGMPGELGATTSSSTMSSASSSTTSTSTGNHLANTTSSSDPGNDLQLRLTLNATVLAPGQSFGITVSEYNTLSTTNNVSAANLWAIDGLELGPCGHSYGPDQGPLGVVIFSGHYTAANASTAQPLEIYPYPIACPQYIRLITGFLFQPLSDDAYYLPSSGGTAGPVSGNVTVSHEYADYSSTGQALNPGVYTVVGGDEWGSLTFLYFEVT